MQILRLYFILLVNLICHYTKMYHRFGSIVFIGSFSSCSLVFPWFRSWWQQAEKISPDFFISSHRFQPTVITPVDPGSLPTGVVDPFLLNTRVHHLCIKVYKAYQQELLSLEEQQEHIYKPSHHAEKPHFYHLYLLTRWGQGPRLTSKQRDLSADWFPTLEKKER